jgi:hypothetical protein
MSSPAQEGDGRRNGNGKRGQRGSGSPPDRLDVDGTTREGEVMLGGDVVNTPLRCRWISPGEGRILPGVYVVVVVAALSRDVKSKDVPADFDSVSSLVSVECLVGQFLTRASQGGDSSPALSSAA